MMIPKAFLALILAPLFSKALVVNNDVHSIPRGADIGFYRNGHSHGPEYRFSKRDGWQSVGVSDLAYKYNTQSRMPAEELQPHHNITMADQHPLPERRDKAWKKRHGAVVEAAKAAEAQMTRGRTSHHKNIVQTLDILDDTISSLQGIGDTEDVVITWYTGEDLQNPSCWPHPEWAPTDESFACALTLEGWTTRPDCFKFLELCNGPEKCIFVRVVDTCAGCQKGSKHVDLTKAAFSKLAHLDEGRLTVNMRLANDPDVWYEDLWGPLL